MEETSVHGVQLVPFDVSSWYLPTRVARTLKYAEEEQSRTRFVVSSFTFELTSYSSITSEVSSLVNQLALAIGELLELLANLSARSEGRLHDDVRTLVDTLRNWTGFSASELADLLSVSRRSLYHWIRAGQASQRNHDRLIELTEALRPIASTWQRPRLRAWLHSGEPSPNELLQTGAFEEFASRASDVLSRREIPLLPSRLLPSTRDVPDERPSPVTRLSSAERHAAFLSFLQPRGGARTDKTWSPREVTDSDEEED